MTTAPAALSELEPDDAFRRLLDYAHRADPYPLYAALRRAPVCRLADGTFLVTGYRELVELVEDPRISSNPANIIGESFLSRAVAGHESDGPSLTSAFVMLDPPDHDRLRRLTMRHFGPPHKPGFVDGLRAGMTRAVGDLIDAFAGRDQVDVVEDFAYPFPVSVICTVLGVPHADERRFHAWSEAIIASAEATGPEDGRQKAKESAAATREMAAYLADLIEAKRHDPGDDLLSGLALDDGPEGRMADTDMVNTAIVLLVGGHETTVNMIANGVLTLLRNPDVLDRLRRDAALAPRVFEELLRFEPPAQITPTRVALTDLTLGGVDVPKGSLLFAVWAAANRDPVHFADPDRFDPDRARIDHLGFGAGIHSCFGAPLARLETQIALVEFFRRVENPRLVSDPPPYRRNPFLRGPQHLPVAFDRVR